MSPSAPAPGWRIGLFLAAVALLPGVLALVAAGVGGVPTTGLVIAEATGAFSVAALQGLDRRGADAPTGAATFDALAPAPWIDPFRVVGARHATDDDDARLADADAHVVPLRL